MIPFFVLAFWDKNTGICAGAMPYRQYFLPLPGSRHAQPKKARCCLQTSSQRGVVLIMAARRAVPPTPVLEQRAFLRHTHERRRLPWRCDAQQGEPPSQCPSRDSARLSPHPRSQSKPRFALRISGICYFIFFVSA